MRCIRRQHSKGIPQQAEPSHFVCIQPLSSYQAQLLCTVTLQDVYSGQVLEGPHLGGLQRVPLDADAHALVRLEAAEDLGGLPVPEERAPLAVAGNDVPPVRGEVDLLAGFRF